MIYLPTNFFFLTRKQVYICVYNITKATEEGKPKTIAKKGRFLHNIRARNNIIISMFI